MCNIVACDTFRGKVPEGLEADPPCPWMYQVSLILVYCFSFSAFYAVLWVSWRNQLNHTLSKHFLDQLVIFVLCKLESEIYRRQ